MDYSDVIRGFLDIFRKSYKMFLKTNGKLISFLTLSFLLLSSILVLSNILLIKPYFVDFVVKLSIAALSQTSPELFPSRHAVPWKHDFESFVGITWLFAVAGTTMSFLFAIATIISSAAAQGGVALNLRALLSCLAKTWKRLLVTLFDVALLDLGYATFSLVSVAPLCAISYIGLEPQWLFSGITFAALALLYFFMSVVWSVAVVVSVLEEQSGTAALARAGEIVKGMKLKGLLLKLFFGVLYYLVLHLLQVVDGARWKETKLGVALVIVNCLCFVKTMSLITFTVFYYECREFHGEGYGAILDGTEYSKAGNEAPLITADNVAP